MSELVVPQTKNPSLPVGDGTVKRQSVPVDHRYSRLATIAQQTMPLQTVLQRP
jgi:hypothetical protein